MHEETISYKNFCCDHCDYSDQEANNVEAHEIKHSDTDGNWIKFGNNVTPTHIFEYLRHLSNELLGQQSRLIDPVVDWIGPGWYCLVNQENDLYDEYKYLFVLMNKEQFYIHCDQKVKKLRTELAKFEDGRSQCLEKGLTREEINRIMSGQKTPNKG